MRITILNGEPDFASAFHAWLCELTGLLGERGHEATRLDLATLELKGCVGCFHCWLRTPGECVRRDGSATVCRAAIGSDLLLMASPLLMGFTSALLKRATDQTIPLLHPYFVVEGGELHHRARYAHYPLMGLLLQAGEDADAEDVAITTALWGRTARNLKSRLAFTALADRSAEEVADALALVA